MTMKTALLSMFLMLFILEAQAMTCWTCNNAKDNDDCIKNGKWTKCQSNQQSCEVEIRRGNYGTMVTKLCKQKEACENNEIQNPRAADPTQCAAKSKSSVCRYCCKDSNLSKISLDCKNVTVPRDDPCTPIKPNQYVVMKCDEKESDSTSPFGTVCTFSCEKGYIMQGAKRSVCERFASETKSTFTHQSPECIPVNCPRNVIANGKVSCSDGTKLDSVCKIVCNVNFYLVANNLAPFATSTNVKCDKTKTSRNDGKGIWNPSPLPTCQPITCRPQIVPINGMISCPDGDLQLGSVCTYSCSNGFYLADELGNFSTTNKTTCVRTITSVVTGRGKWSLSKLICKPKPTRCPLLSHTANGNITCTNSNYVGSLCKYVCNRDYYLANESNTMSPHSGNVECVSTQSSDKTEIGKWNNTLICDIITCNVLPQYPNVNISCTNQTFVNSVCKFPCDSISMPQEIVSNATCVARQVNNGIGTWEPTNYAPNCPKILCPVRHTDEKVNINCHSIAIGGNCTYSCPDPKETLVDGPNITYCLQTSNKTANWSTFDQPKCIIQCPLLSHIPNGNVTCTNSNLLGSVCKHSCNPNYFLANKDGAQANLPQLTDSVKCVTTQSPDPIKTRKWNNTLFCNEMKNK